MPCDSTEHGVLYVKYASVLLQAMTVEMDEDFLFALYDFSKFENASWRSLFQSTLGILHPQMNDDSDEWSIQSLDQ